MAGALLEMAFLPSKFIPAPHVQFESFDLVNSFFFYFDEQRTSEGDYLQLGCRRAVYLS